MIERTNKQDGLNELTDTEIQLVSGGVQFGGFWCGPDGCYADGWWTEFWAY